MAGIQPNPAPATPTDDFQRAAAGAEEEAGKRRWCEMFPMERTRAIYSSLRRIDAERVSLRRIDAERVVSLHFIAGRHGRFPVAGESTNRAR